MRLYEGLGAPVIQGFNGEYDMAPSTLVIYMSSVI